MKPQWNAIRGDSGTSIEPRGGVEPHLKDDTRTADGCGSLPDVHPQQHPSYPVGVVGWRVCVVVVWVFIVWVVMVWDCMIMECLFFLYDHKKIFDFTRLYIKVFHRFEVFKYLTFYHNVISHIPF